MLTKTRSNQRWIFNILKHVSPGRQSELVLFFSFCELKNKFNSNQKSLLMSWLQLWLIMHLPHRADEIWSLLLYRPVISENLGLKIFRHGWTFRTVVLLTRQWIILILILLWCIFSLLENLVIIPAILCVITDFLKNPSCDKYSSWTL